MRKFFQIFFVFLIFILLSVFPKELFAAPTSPTCRDGYLVEVTPTTLSLGQVVIIKSTVTLTGSGCTYPQDVYLQIIKTSGSSTGLGPGEGTFLFHINTPAANIKCTNDQLSPVDPALSPNNSKRQSCTRSNDATLIFINEIDTSKLVAGIDRNSGTNLHYTARIAAGAGGGILSTPRDFSIQAPNPPPSATFRIIDISPDKPKPGTKITITLLNAQNGEYEYGIDDGRGEIDQSTLQKQLCNSGDCWLTELTVPTLTSNNIIGIVVRGPGGKAIRDIQIDIPTVTPINPGILAPGGAGAPLTPKPPTPTPPLSPCAEWVDQFGKVLSKESAAKTDLKRCTKVDTGLGIPLSTDPVGFVKSIFAIILSLSGGIALLLIILSGYKLMLSQGNPEKAQEAKETLTAAIVGLLFIIFSLVILQVIGVDILRIPEFGK